MKTKNKKFNKVLLPWLHKNPHIKYGKKSKHKYKLNKNTFTLENHKEFYELTLEFEKKYELNNIEIVFTDGIFKTDNPLAINFMSGFTECLTLKEKEEQEIIKKPQEYEMPINFCTEITDGNKDIILKLWSFTKENDIKPYNFSLGKYLHSNSLFTYLEIKNGIGGVKVVSTEEFLRYIGKENLIKENDKTTLEFYLPKKNIETHTVELREDSIILKEMDDNIVEFLGENTNVIFKRIGEYYGMSIDLDSMTKEQHISFFKICNDHREKYGIVYETPKSKTYTKEDMIKCFEQSRRHKIKTLTDRTMFFNNFEEYLNSIE